jgi:hypothetical protein
MTMCHCPHQQEVEEFTWFIPGSVAHLAEPAMGETLLGSFTWKVALGLLARFCRGYRKAGTTVEGPVVENGSRGGDSPAQAKNQKQETTCWGSYLVDFCSTYSTHTNSTRVAV